MEVTFNGQHLVEMADIGLRLDRRDSLLGHGLGSVQIDKFYQGKTR